MSLSQLDERIALVVIDLQKGTVASPTSTHQVAEVVERAARLARSFRERGLPVVLVTDLPFSVGAFLRVSHLP
jgi:nicotinamidase-related amidase